MINLCKSIVASGLGLGALLASAAGPAAASDAGRVTLRLTFTGIDMARDWVRSIQTFADAGVLRTEVVDAGGRTYCRIYRDRFDLPGCPSELGPLAQQLNGVAPHRLAVDAQVRVPAVDSRQELVERSFDLSSSLERWQYQAHLRDFRPYINAVKHDHTDHSAIATLTLSRLTSVIDGLDEPTTDRMRRLIEPAKGLVAEVVVAVPPVPEFVYGSLAVPRIDIEMPVLADLLVPEPAPQPVRAAETPIPPVATTVDASIGSASLPLLMIGAIGIAVGLGSGLVPSVLLILGLVTFIQGGGSPGLAGSGGDPAAYGLSTVQGVGLLLILLSPVLGGQARAGERGGLGQRAHAFRRKLALWLAPELDERSRSNREVTQTLGPPPGSLRGPRGPVSASDPDHVQPRRSPVMPDRPVTVLGRRKGLEDLVTLHA